MEKASEQEVSQAQWWGERFGEHGKGNPTDLEKSANYELYLLFNSLPPGYC